MRNDQLTLRGEHLDKSFPPLAGQTEGHVVLSDLSLEVRQGAAGTSPYQSSGMGHHPSCFSRLPLLHRHLQSLGFLLCCSVLAGLLGMVSLWFGFRKKSVSVTIVASVILVTIVCQVISAALLFLPIMGIVFGVTGILQFWQCKIY